MTTKSTKPKQSLKGKTLPKSPTPYHSPTVSDDEEVLDYADVPTPTRLNNCYAEWLDPQNTKSQRKLAEEHGVGKTSLQNRIKGAKSKAQKAQNRQRLTILEELALKDWCQ